MTLYNHDTSKLFQGLEGQILEFSHRRGRTKWGMFYLWLHMLKEGPCNS